MHFFISLNNIKKKDNLYKILIFGLPYTNIKSQKKFIFTIQFNTKKLKSYNIIM